MSILDKVSKCWQVVKALFNRNAWIYILVLITIQAGWELTNWKWWAASVFMIFTVNIAIRQAKIDVLDKLKKNVGQFDWDAFEHKCNKERGQ